MLLTVHVLIERAHPTPMQVYTLVLVSRTIVLIDHPPSVQCLSSDTRPKGLRELASGSLHFPSLAHHSQQQGTSILEALAVVRNEIEPPECPVQNPDIPVCGPHETLDAPDGLLRQPPECLF